MPVTLLALDDLSDFKYFQVQKPAAGKLLREIIFRWRNSNARIPGKGGKWATWPIEQWCEWTELPRRTVNRALGDLEAHGLIHRERHKFAGNKVRTFVSPTVVALEYAGRPNDVQRMAKVVTPPGSDAGPVVAPFPTPDFTPPEI